MSENASDATHRIKRKKQLFPMPNYVIWIPIIAQEDLWLVHRDDLYYSYPTTEIDRFYHIHTHLDLPSQRAGESHSFEGAELTVNVRIYRSEAKKKNKEKEDLYFLPTPNRIKAISKTVYNDFINDLNTSKTVGFKRAYQLYRQKIHPEGMPFTVVFTLDKYMPNGLCSFSVQTEAPRQLKEFENDICRQIKFHFHTDHYHEPSVMIAPYRGVVRIGDQDNEALQYHIEAFHKSLTTTLHSLYLDYKRVDVAEGKKQSRKERKQARRNKLEFYDRCHNLVGQWVFLQTLLKSPENKACRPDATPGEGQKDYSVIARNFDNIKEGTEALRNKLRHHHDEENLRLANRANKLNTRLAWLSFGLGILSVILGVVSILLALFSFEIFSTLKDDLYNYLTAHLPR